MQRGSDARQPMAVRVLIASLAPRGTAIIRARSPGVPRKSTMRATWVMVRFLDLVAICFSHSSTTQFLSACDKASIGDHR